MKLKDFLPNIAEPEYRLMDSVNYSLLKNISEKGPRAIIEGSPDIYGDGVTLGTIVDKVLSDPSYVVESEYYISDTKLDLSGDTHLSKILQFLKNNNDMFLPRNDNDVFLRICSILGFKRNPTPDDNFWEQLDLLNLLNSGQKVLSTSEYELAKTMINSLQTHPYTSAIFNTGPDTEVLNQVVVTVELNGVRVKILIDKLLVNHSLKKIKIFDIKTGSSNFMKNFYTYKYYYQGSLYYTVLSKFLKSIPEFSEYELVDGFGFIYVSRENPNIPYLYIMGKDYIDMVLNGYEGVNGMETKGIYQLLSDYSWYKSNEIYDMDRSVFESNGVITIKQPFTWKTEK